MKQLNELQILTALQSNTPDGTRLRAERGQMIIEVIAQRFVRDQLNGLAWLNTLKSKSLGHSKTSRQLFRAKKYDFAQLPFRLAPPTIKNVTC